MSLEFLSVSFPLAQNNFYKINLYHEVASRFFSRFHIKREAGEGEPTCETERENDGDAVEWKA